MDLKINSAKKLRKGDGGEAYLIWMDVAGWQLLLRSSPYLLSEALETTLTSAHDPLSTENEIISLTTPRSPPLHSAPPPSPLAPPPSSLAPPPPYQKTVS